MIDAIGIKKIIIILVLIATNCFLAVMNFYVFEPQLKKSKQELNTVMSESATLTDEIKKMKSDFVSFQEIVSAYKQIEKKGFIGEQDRVLARQRFDSMQKQSKVLAAKYEIKSAEEVEDANADKAGYRKLTSPISIDLSAIDDIDIYRFIYFLNYGFPGHVAIRDIEIKRNVEVSAASVKQIGTGSPPIMVSAKMNIDWTTLAKKRDLDVVSSEQGGM